MVISGTQDVISGADYGGGDFGYGLISAIFSTFTYLQKIVGRPAKNSSTTNI